MDIKDFIELAAGWEFLSTDAIDAIGAAAENYHPYHINKDMLNEAQEFLESLDKAGVEVTDALRIMGETDGVE